MTEYKGIPRSKLIVRMPPGAGIPRSESAAQVDPHDAAAEEQALGTTDGPLLRPVAGAGRGWTLIYPPDYKGKR
jgi:hypothetical protein